MASAKISYPGFVNKEPIIGKGLNSIAVGSLLTIYPNPNSSNPASTVNPPKLNTLEYLFPPLKNISINSVLPANGGPTAINFFIFGIRSLWLFFIMLLYKVIVPNECPIRTTGYPVLLYNISIRSLNDDIVKSFLAKNWR